MTIPRRRAGIKVDAIHDERGYRRVRRELARQYDVGFIDANIEVVDVDLAGDRRLMLRHAVLKGAQLNETDAKRVLQHLADLWSYDVSLVEVDASDTVLKEYVTHPRKLAAAADVAFSSQSSWRQDLLRRHPFAIAIELADCVTHLGSIADG